MSKSTIELDDVALMTTAGELRTLVGQLRRKLSEQAGPGDYTLSQTSALSRLLNDGPSTLTALAAAEGMRPQSMSAIIALLESDGLVAGSPDPTDGRRTILAITDEAIDRVKASRAAKDDWLFRAIRSRLDSNEQAQLASSIALVRRLLEP